MYYIIKHAKIDNIQSKDSAHSRSTMTNRLNQSLLRESNEPSISIAENPNEQDAQDHQRAIRQLRQQELDRLQYTQNFRFPPQDSTDPPEPRHRPKWFHYLIPTLENEHNRDFQDQHPPEWQDPIRQSTYEEHKSEIM